MSTTSNGTKDVNLSSMDINDDNLLEMVKDAFEEKGDTYAPQSIDLSDNDISSLHLLVKAFQALPSHRLALLVFIRIDYNRIDENGIQDTTISCLLETCPKLSALSLAHNELGNQATLSLFRQLDQSHTRLSFISLEDNSIQGSLALEQLLQYVTNTENLSLRLHLGGNDLDVQGTQTMAQVLESNSLRSLDLSGCDIGDKGAVLLGHALLANRNLVRLNLSRNRLTSVGLSSLFRSLKGHECLEILVLDENDSTRPPGSMDEIPAEHLEDGSYLYLKQYLMENKILLQLHLNDCMLCDVGAEECAEGLPRNTTLQRLEIGNNRITSRGLFKLFDGLAENTALKHVNISGNATGNAQVSEGLDYLLKNFRNDLHIVEHRHTIPQDFEICHWSSSARPSLHNSDTEEE